MFDSRVMEKVSEEKSPDYNVNQSSEVSYRTWVQQKTTILMYCGVIS